MLQTIIKMIIVIYTGSARVILSRGLKSILQQMLMFSQHFGGKSTIFPH